VKYNAPQTITQQKGSRSGEIQCSPDYNTAERFQVRSLVVNEKVWSHGIFMSKINSIITRGPGATSLT
jgi:hypothetical protein